MSFVWIIVEKFEIWHHKNMIRYAEINSDVEKKA